MRRKQSFSWSCPFVHLDWRMLPHEKVPKCSQTFPNIGISYVFLPQNKSFHQWSRDLKIKFWLRWYTFLGGPQMNAFNFTSSKILKNSHSWNTTTSKVWILKTVLLVKSWKNLPSCSYDEKSLVRWEDGEIKLSLLGAMMMIEY